MSGRRKITMPAQRTPFNPERTIKLNLDVIKTADWVVDLGAGRWESWGAYYCGGYAGAGG